MISGASSDRRVHVRAPGKINVFFEVGDVQPDGYHDVASLYQAVSLYEDLWASLDEVDAIAVTGDVDVSGVPLDASNLALRAARLVARRLGYDGGIRLDIRKGVPVAGGMGGGSADAAAALVAVNDLLDGHLTTADLQELGAGLGADVPFAVLGGTAVGTGRGDELATALVRGRFDWVLVTDADGLSTPAVYAELDRLRGEVDIRPRAEAPAVDPAVLQALRAGEAAALGAVIRNDLQHAALSLRPSLQSVLDEQHQSGVLAGIVSGSGPTIALLAEGPGDAERTVARFADSGLTAYAAHGPVPGARVISH
ncbi:MAG: 4-(cytidine 5'-diphospho)-2-C-methyl-D-erythritol kinase [Microbacterium sp. SCN 70-27]|mgnify:FL=1|nr:4-(cytidine 5'-diphospho)-2-C-methyl-D-erythritol kinase [Microbacterium sp.]ODT27664.1 MAG: 4-(cytidine 5'-diphospho)-2-C-methyl-D-erythritol kinase [Microbacterium sp. SCN 70-27]